MKQTSLALAFAVITAGLHAQTTTDAPASSEPEASLLPTTVVTGDLWESELQRTTASVSVIDHTSLDINGVQHFEDVINAIPNLTWTGGSSRPRFIQIRGIGENSQFEGETPDSAVRFLIDDLDLTGLGTVGNLFDVQQVEVLRGPQAGAFGANAAGGVIKILTNDPTPYWTGQVEGTVGQDSLLASGLAVGGPIIDSDPETLTFRLAIHQLNQNGFRDNKYLGKEDTNERDEFTSRLKLRWLANEDWQWDGTLLYADADNGYDEWSLDNTEADTFSDQPGRDEQETVAGSVRGTWNGLENIKFTSITSYTNTDALYSYDSDWGAGFAALPPANSGYSGILSAKRERDVFSEDLRFDSKDQTDALGLIDRWTVGVYYHRLKEDSRILYQDFDFFDNAEVESEYQTDTYAIYTQFAHDFSQDTRLTIGLRFEHHQVDFDSVTLDNSDLDFDTNPDLLERGSDSVTNDLWGGKITLEHDLTNSQTLFASVTRGYKAGGANTGVFRASDDPSTYSNESLWNYELGLISQWFDGKVDSKVTLFYLDRDAPQLRDSEGSGGFFRYFTENADEAQHYGLETETMWYISPNWSASAGIGLLETEDDDNDDLANAPNYTFNASLNYQADNGFFATLAAQGSDEYYESNNKDQRDQRVRNSFVTFNGSIGYRYQNWTFTVWGKNLFDEGYEKRVFFFDNFHPDDGFVPGSNRRYESHAEPQQFGITANYRW
jgi:outer membrane receptor protein involved in Fe transport